MNDLTENGSTGRERRLQAYGLVISAEIDLPELAPGDPGRRPDLSIIEGPVHADDVIAREHGAGYWISETDFVFHVTGVARYRVQGGRNITFEPAPGAHEASIRLFLLGTALGAALMQRGYLVLHGNAIRVDERCLICLGPCGAGKSTLAAGFMQRGYELLADDVVAVNQDGAVLPGIPRIKLWQDAASNLSIDTTDLDRIQPGYEKYNVPVDTSFAPRAAPVRWAYLLEPSEDADFRIERITGMAKYPPLFSNTYRAGLIDGMGLRAAHLEQCGRLASRITLSRIVRPKQGFDLDGLIQRLLDDIAATE
jgi:hypothetical protein